MFSSRDAYDNDFCPVRDELLGEMYAHWPFAAALVDDVEVILAKADLGIATFYDQLARPEHERFASAIRCRSTSRWVRS